MNRRRIILAAAFLFLGAIINIAIAWLAVARGSLIMLEGQSVRPPTARPDNPMSGWSAPIHLDWPWPVPADWPPLQSHSQSHSFGLFWIEGTDNDGQDPTATTHTVTGIRAGWPFKSMSWVRWSIRDNGITRWSAATGDLECPASSGTLSQFGTINGPIPRRLPITPIWLPFIANTLLYAAACALLILALRKAKHSTRRSRRLRANQCVACGYPIHGPTCPECGAATEPSLTQSQAPAAR